MVSLARSEPGVPVRPDELDQDPWLLNILNGTIDLRNGELGPHDPDHMITKLAPVGYDPTASCPLWLQFLDKIMDGNEGLIQFLKRAIGYSLTGIIREHVLFVCHGDGRNGKSTFLETILGLLGDYSRKAPPSLLMLKRGKAHPTERAMLYGSRFVPAIESAEDNKFEEAIVKELTGGDTISARRMREDFWDFSPTHHLWLATNHKPVITGTDSGIWSRIALIPFSITIPEQERDTTLAETLQAEWPGIL